MKILDWMPGESACGYALRVIQHNIVHLELAPGSRVSSNGLADALSLSRMPVREALGELSRMGLVEILPQRGSYVARIDYGLVEESRFMRLVLEVAVARLACEGISTACMDALRANLQAMEQAGSDEEKSLELDNEFHRLLFASVHREWTYEKLHAQMVHFDRLRRLAISTITAKAGDTLRDHEDILYAITRHDAEMAEMLVTRHLSRYQVEIGAIMEQYPDYFVKGERGSIFPGP